MSLNEEEYRLRSKKHFNKQAAKYDHTWDGRYCLKMYPMVLEKINSYLFSSILDVGCGSGRLLELLISKYPNIEAFGIDLSENMIAQAKNNLHSNVQLVTGDVEDMPWPDNVFDLMICNGSFHHYPNPQKSLQEMQRVLKSNGQLLIADPWWPDRIRNVINYYLKSPLNASGDVWIYSQQDIKQLFAKTSFRSIQWELIDKTYFIVTAINN